MKCRRSSGARTAGALPSSTTSAGTRSIGSSRSTPRAARRAPSISEEPKTFFYLLEQEVPLRCRRTARRSSGCRSATAGTISIFIDGATGSARTRSPRANWVVRERRQDRRRARQIWFSASGMYPGKDPYFVHYYRINFDGTGLTPLTEADANHSVSFSPDMKYYVDTYSRVDLAPVMELRQAADGKLDHGTGTRRYQRTRRKPAGRRRSRSWRRAATARPTSGA